MLFIIFSEDVPHSLPLRAGARPAHLQRLTELNEQGRLVIAGPNPATDCYETNNAGFTGSTVIAEFDSLADAQAWADTDPYVEAGVYASVVVKPFKRVLP